MRLSDMSFFNLASRRMNWLGVRQQVVAQNIANANTPGYRAQDVSAFADVLRGTSGAVMTTNTKHISGLNKGSGDISIQDDRDAYETSLDGNTVALEQQTINSTEVTENYRLAAQLYRKGHEMLTLAATGTR